MAAQNWTRGWSPQTWTSLLVIASMVGLQLILETQPRKDPHHRQEPLWTETHHRQPWQVPPQLEGPRTVKLLKDERRPTQPQGETWWHQRQGPKEMEQITPLPPPAQWQTRTATVQVMHPTAGRKPACSWKATPLKKQWKGCTHSTDKSCRRDECRADRKPDVWLDFDGRPTCQIGTKCKQKPGKGLLGSDWRNGASLSMQLPMKSGAAAESGHALHGHLPNLDLRNAPFRPRSLRAVVFQKPCHLHPHFKSHKPCRRYKQPLRHSGRDTAYDPGAAKPTLPRSFGLAPHRPKINKPRQCEGLIRKPKAFPGPKSGTSLLHMCFILSLKETSGVRVPRQEVDLWLS